MADYVSREILDAVRALGEMIRADKRCQAYREAAEIYEKDEEIGRLVAEYNVQQAALSEQYAGEERDEAAIRAIQDRIDTLYETITGRASYQDYIRTKDENDAFIRMVTAELEAAITGRAACTHDCSSCRAACGGCAVNGETR